MLLIILVASICVSAFPSETEAIGSLPEELLQKCKASNPLTQQCHVHKYEDLRPYLIKGIPEQNVPPLDPLYIPKLTVGKRQSSLTSYEGQFKNVVFTGLRNYQVLDVSVDSRELIYRLKFLVPAIRLTTSFSAKGNILGVQLDGEGRMEVDITNLILDYVLDGEIYIKDNQEHVYWREGSTEISYDTSHFRLYDFIKNHFELMMYNQAVNENTEAVRPPFVSLLHRTIGNYIINSLNLIYEAVPKDKLLPSY